MLRSSRCSCVWMLYGCVLLIGCSPKVETTSPEAAKTASPAAEVKEGTLATDSKSADGQATTAATSLPDQPLTPLKPPPGKPEGAGGGDRPEVPANATEKANAAVKTPSPGQLDFTQLALPENPTPQQVIDHLARIDKAFQTLLQTAGTPQMNRDEATRQARVLSDKKLEAAEAMAVVAELPLHKELAKLAKMEALSHAAGLGDAKGAADLRAFAASAASFESQVVAHQAAIVMLGLEMSDLAAGLTNTEPVLLQLDTILKDRENLKIPDFHATAQAIQVLEQHGFDEAAALAKEKAVAAFSDHPDPQIAMKLWFFQVGSTPEFTALNQAIQKPDSSISEVRSALTAVEEKGKSQWTLAYLGQNLTNLEYSGQLEKSGLIAEFIEERLDWVTLAELRQETEELLAGYQKRIGSLGKTPSWEGLVTLPDGKPFSADALKGKVVLVDYWASWCGPCRAEFPNMRTLFDKYRDRGFVIVGINVDQRQEDMMQILSNEPLPWIHVRSANPDAVGFSTPQAVDVGLTAIPFMMLLDTEGKVMAIHTRGPALAERLAELFP